MRELAHELGLALSPQRLTPLSTFEDAAANEPGHRAEGYAPRAELTAAEAAEIEELRWASVAKTHAMELAPLTRSYFVPLPS